MEDTKHLGVVLKRFHTGQPTPEDIDFAEQVLFRATRHGASEMRYGMRWQTTFGR